MPLLGALIKQGLKLTTRVNLRTKTPSYYQRRELRKLMSTAEMTSFGKHYNFFQSLNTEGDFEEEFRKNVPLFDYDKIFAEWWHRCLEEENDVCWPGHVKYFALSSGTAGSASKHIPVTREMVRALRKASIRQISTLGKYDLPATTFEKGILWLGGSTDLKKQGGYFEGDVSGISARQVPIWFQQYYKPGKKISKEKDWNIKLEEITRQAGDWDIGIITGVPSWVQLLLEKIIAHYKLNTIHDLWPNLAVYAHGGVSFEPYRHGLQKYFSKKVHFIEMYPASEGFIAFQSEPDVRHMKLITDNGIYYEFLPFNEDNFDAGGDFIQGGKTLTIGQVQENTDYALVMSTCAGAWRYIIGDVIRFTDAKKAKIHISGRTKSFLSLTGEHLSVDNMNKAVEFAANEIGEEIPEYTVSGIPFEGMFAHEWYIGTRNHTDAKRVRDLIDQKLSELNDDYKVERESALKEVFVHAVPLTKFYEFMSSKGKMGGQNKFPRVMKPKQFEEWKTFLNK
jgi:hypothetical protein